MDTKAGFAAAVEAIVGNHRNLYGRLIEAFKHYGAAAKGLPPRAKRVSRILDCESNGAHILLEDLASAAKALPRGSIGEHADVFLAECRDFLYYLEDNLKCPKCAGIINEICQVEEAFVNLIKGISGCDPNISKRAYWHRIDKFIRDLKALFRDLGRAVVELEYQLAERGKTTGNPHEKDMTKTIECAQSAIVKEVQRQGNLTRQEYRNAGEATSKPDKRPLCQRKWIDKAVRLYVTRHDIEGSYTSFLTCCRKFWEEACDCFKCQVPA